MVAQFGVTQFLFKRDPARIFATLRKKKEAKILELGLYFSFLVPSKMPFYLVVECIQGFETTEKNMTKIPSPPQEFVEGELGTFDGDWGGTGGCRPPWLGALRPGGACGPANGTRRPHASFSVPEHEGRGRVICMDGPQAKLGFL